MDTKRREMGGGGEEDKEMREMKHACHALSFCVGVCVIVPFFWAREGGWVGCQLDNRHIWIGMLYRSMVT